MPSAHRHDDIELNFAESGELVYLFGGEEVVILPGVVTAFWGAMPHQLVHCPPESSAHWLTIPLSYFVRWGLPEEFVEQIFQGHVLASTGQTVRREDSLRFAQWSRDLESDSEYDQVTANLEIQARLRRLAHETASQPSATEPDRRYQDLNIHRAAAMARFIAEHYSDPLRVEDIAGAVSLHPHYAMTVFRRVVGTTLLSYLTQCRITEAQRLLITTDLTTSEIGNAVGFHSQSQFYACFHRLCGQPPGTYRRSHHNAQCR
ncbi:helix-turn-helix domain-containing protein [Allokutzneria sp. A3M-2-11 16]|uniref:helix-turn-helix domain-containing protein n=1 Tax=Allokutzneria sp. A3M-2-11 16 TaxID=2962043 RepID=UPI0020B83014|nr:helix-turn-helix domain-containing protein [Allokutzneria sp. A3M-2-11 16]MCP3803405.1 helix-turn-helix domain-containing protein [Allokutzneria sp. A3M-2-11 16]